MEGKSGKEVFRNGDKGEMKLILLPLKNVVASRAFLAIFVSLLAISLSITYVASEPRPEMHFFSISTLGKNMMTENYYPRNNATIYVGDNLNWHISVYNNMGEAEYVSVRVKLLNATQSIPDDTLQVPSSEQHIAEFKHMLMNDSTWVTPLRWSIIDTEEHGDYNVIRSIEINGIKINNLDVRSLDGQDFRMVIELWRYDPEIGSFAFAWNTGLEDRSAWNQIWFDLK